VDGLVCFHGYLKEVEDMAKAAPAKKPLTKTQVMAAIAETTGISKKDVAAVFEALAEEISKAVSSRGPGAFTIPGLIKISKKKVPAKKAKKDWLNPLTGNTQDVPAKPAYTKVQVRALKALKDMV
jgi:nucleoid DNA-binding protein